MRKWQPQSWRKMSGGKTALLMLAMVLAGVSIAMALAGGSSGPALAGPAPDTDGDGCPDQRELGPVASFGGQRNPNYFWDFFDTPTGVHPNLNRDGSVSGFDFFSVLGRFNTIGDPGIDPLSAPPAGLTYHTAYDRSFVKGIFSGPADGSITGSDFFLVLGQFNHDCSGPVPAIWQPTPGTTWQWQLSGVLDTSVPAQVYDIDVFDHSSSVVAGLHAQGRKVICYMSAGAWEEFRPDAGDFPASVKGNDNGWPGEKWLDIRQLNILGPIMEARLDLCASKGFDAVEFDNVDAYNNITGFPITFQDQITYNTFLANKAHERGLAAGLKNDLPQVEWLLPLYEFAVNEQCFSGGDCLYLVPFINAGKAVFAVEYDLATADFCPQAQAMNFSAMKKNMVLDAYREACWP